MWSSISTIYSLSPFSSAPSWTLPKVSPMIEISMFMKITETKNVEHKNMNITKWFPYPVLNLDGEKFPSAPII